MQLPAPTGPHAIGTITYHWTDESRRELFTGDGAPRELMVQLWYPAIPDPELEPVRYVEDGRLLRPLARLMGLPETTFDELDQVRTHALPSAKVADAEARYPVLVFSPGRCGFRQHNTNQVEALVSHGFVVASVDHPSAATGVAFPDGRRVFVDERLLPPWPLERRPGHDGEVQDATLAFLAADDRFVLDRLAAVDRGDLGGLLAHRLDMGRIGAFGVSLGAMDLAEATSADERIRALLVMDAAIPPPVVRTGLRVPVMWLTRDAETMRREGWDPRDITSTLGSLRAVFDRLPGAAYIVLVPGTFHPDFSDGRLLSPVLASRGITGPIDGDRARAILNAYALAFFDRHLRGGHSELLAGPSRAFPEARFERRHGREVRSGRETASRAS